MLKSLLIVLLVLACVNPVLAQPHTASRTVSWQASHVDEVVPPEFFGLFVGGISYLNPTLTYGTMATTGQVNWPKLNPSLDTYDWSSLDQLIAYAKARNSQIIYLITGTPAWASRDPMADCIDGPGTCSPPANETYWVKFITALAKHAGSRINYYEVWNEAQNRRYWAGTPGELVRLTQLANTTIKAINPNAKIISASVTDYAGGGPRWLALYLAAGGAKYVDIMAFHGYGSEKAEDILAVWSSFHKTLTAAGAGGLPFWDTEGDWAGNCGCYALPLSRQPAFIAKYILLHWTLKAGRFLWYSYDGGDVFGGLVRTNTSTETITAMAYKETYKWMVGAQMTKLCAVDQSYNWSCGLARAGWSGMALWNSTVRTKYAVPSKYSLYRDLEGMEHPVIGNSVTVGDNPILLETGPLL